MKRKSLIAIAVVLSLVFTATVPAMAQTPAPTPTQPPTTASTALFVTSNFLVNVRSGPGTEYTILGKARSGDAFDVTGKLANGSWFRINFAGQEGWILASLVNPTGDLTTAPEAVAGSSAVLRSAASATTSTGSATAVPGAVEGTTTGSVNLRSVPTTTGSVLVVVPFSTKLTATGRTTNNNWVQVTFNNQTGWITSAVYSVSRGNVNTLPVFDASGVAVPAVAATATKSP